MSELRNWFDLLCKVAPYPYQERVAEALLSGSSVVLRAPTGAGKTRAAILPFLIGMAKRLGPARLIYVLPMRTLAQGIHREAFDLVRRARDAGLLDAVLPGEPIHDQGDVRLQTGEAPGDPFFSEARIVVATYDQLLSGLLHAPYGSSDRLHNINGAAIAGALVVFDEFHLMEIGRAFMTATAFAKWFEGLCRTVWMTATATSSVVDVLTRDLGCREVVLSPEEEAALPSVGSVVRELEWQSADLTAEDVLLAHKSRSIVICNTVARAQEMASRLRALAAVPVTLLHSRFFQRDRREREADLRRVFGKEGDGGAILVATQVVEAGLDVTCEHLWTELCPMNALVQRAGRCARFEGEHGTVHVRRAPGAPPYTQKELDAVAAVLPRTGRMTPDVCREWVERTHGQDDAASVQVTTLGSRLRECRDIVKKQVVRVFDKVRQENREARKNPTEPYKSTIAFRELVHHRGNLKVAFEATEDLGLRLESLGPVVNQFGKRGSFFQFTNLERKAALGAEFTQPVQSGKAWECPARAHVVPADDFGPQADLKVLSSFTDAQAKRDRHRTFVPTVVPLGMVNTGPGFTEYRRG